MMGHVFHVISLHCAPHKITCGSSLLMEKSKVEESPRLEKQTSKKEKKKKTGAKKKERKKERVPSFGNFARYCVVLLNAPLSD